MSTQILMPALSPTMEEGKLAKWHVHEGDEVHAGDVIAEIETDKATMEMEAANDGKISKILVPEGTEHIPINKPIAILVTDGEDANANPPSFAAQPDATSPSTAPPPPLTSEAPLEVEQASAKTEAGSPGPKPEAEAKEEIAAGTEMATITVREALRDAMAEEMRRDGDVFVMGEEVAQYEGAYKVTQGLLDEFGQRRVIDTPITEYGFTGVGVGAAFAGLRPIVEFMTWNFAMQAIDHIVNSAAKTHYMSGGQMHCPIVFRGPNGPAARVAAQHSQDYSSWYAHVPGLKVIAPYDAADAKGLLKAAIRDNSPVIFLESELLYSDKGEVPTGEGFLIPIGKARIAREGSDVTLVSYSRGMMYTLEAAETLAKEGMEAEVIDLRTLRPLDIDTVVASVKKTNRLVTVEEGWSVGSIGSEIGSQVMALAFDYLDAPPLKITGADVPMPYAANLEKLALPSVEKVVSAAKSVCYRG